MKKLVFFFMLLPLLMAVSSGCSTLASGTVDPVATQIVAISSPSVAAYQDGTYEYQGLIDGEGYYVKGKLTVSSGKIASAEWAIYDFHRKDKVFDKEYEVVFSGNDTYIQQCRDNLTGMAGYAPKLVETQDAAKVDAVTGATWAYKKFEEFAKGALKKAEGK